MFVFGNKGLYFIIIYINNNKFSYKDTNLNKYECYQAYAEA